MGRHVLANTHQLRLVQSTLPGTHIVLPAYAPAVAMLEAGNIYFAEVHGHSLGSPHVHRAAALFEALGGEELMDEEAVAAHIVAKAVVDVINATKRPEDSAGVGEGDAWASRASSADSHTVDPQPLRGARVQHRGGSTHEEPDVVHRFRQAVCLLLLTAILARGPALRGAMERSIALARSASRSAGRSRGAGLVDEPAAAVAASLARASTILFCILEATARASSRLHAGRGAT